MLEEGLAVSVCQSSPGGFAMSAPLRRLLLPFFASLVVAGCSAGVREDRTIQLRTGWQAGGVSARPRRYLRRRKRGRGADENLPAGCRCDCRQHAPVESDRQTLAVHDGQKRRQEDEAARGLARRVRSGRRSPLGAADAVHLLAAQRAEGRTTAECASLHRALRPSRLRRRQPRRSLASRRATHPLRQARRQGMVWPA